MSSKPETQEFENVNWSHGHECKHTKKVIILTGGAFEFPALLVVEGFDCDGVSFSFSVDFIFSGVESGELGNGD